MPDTQNNNPFVNDDLEDVRVFTAYYTGEATFLKLIYAARALVDLPGAVINKRQESTGPANTLEDEFSFTILQGRARGNYSFKFRSTVDYKRVGVVFEYIDKPACGFLENVLPTSHVWTKYGCTPWGGNFPDPNATFKRLKRWAFSLVTIAVIGYATLELINYLKG